MEEKIRNFFILAFHGLFIWGVVEFTLFWKPWEIGWSGYIALIFCMILMFCIFMGKFLKETDKPVTKKQ